MRIIKSDMIGKLYPMESCGLPWDFMEPYGTLCDLMGPCGILWDPVGSQAIVLKVLRPLREYQFRNQKPWVAEYPKFGLLG